MVLRECLKNHINFSDKQVVKCPYIKEYSCDSNLNDEEIRELLDLEEYKNMQMKNQRLAAANMMNSIQCRSPDCNGKNMFYIYFY